jgi:hypothetical protein
LDFIGGLDLYQAPADLQFFTRLTVIRLAMEGENADAWEDRQTPPFVTIVRDSKVPLA